ncbi:MAG TPA: TRAP transporter small permease [Eoetvoesiella sp.]
MAETCSSRHAGLDQYWGMRAYRYLVLGTGIAAAFLFGLMAILVCADVLLRNVGGASMPWSVEVTEYMLMVAAFLAAPWVLYTNDHIRVDVLVRGLPPRVQLWLALAGDVVCLFICLVLAWESVLGVLDSRAQGGLVFKVLVFPDWWLGLPMVFCFILLTIEFARRIALSFVNRKDA